MPEWRDIMKYKLLLTGKSINIINEFFTQMEDYFECLSSTTNYSDLSGHFKYFTPDAVVYCMASETRDDITSIINLKKNIFKPATRLILTCTDDDLANYQNLAEDDYDLVLKRPILSHVIRENLHHFLSKKGAASSNITPQDAPLDVDKELEELEALARTIQKGTSTTKATAKLLQELVPRKRVMIVDDSPVMLKTIKGHLDEEYEVATAISGKIALRYLQTKPVELILLDYEMPDENGPAVMEKLLANPATANIPVVFLTGTNDAVKIQKALSLKPRGYLLKPIDKETLLTKVHEILEQ